MCIQIAFREFFSSNTRKQWQDVTKNWSGGTGEESEERDLCQGILMPWELSAGLALAWHWSIALSCFCDLSEHLPTGVAQWLHAQLWSFAWADNRLFCPSISTFPFPSTCFRGEPQRLSTAAIILRFRGHRSAWLWSFRNLGIFSFCSRVFFISIQWCCYFQNAKHCYICTAVPREFGVPTTNLTITTVSTIKTKFNNNEGLHHLWNLTTTTVSTITTKYDNNEVLHHLRNLTTTTVSTITTPAGSSTLRTVSAPRRNSVQNGDKLNSPESPTQLDLSGHPG